MTSDGQVVTFLRPVLAFFYRFIFLFFYFFTYSEGEAQAKVVAADDRRAPVAGRHTAAPGVVEPTAATVHAVKGRTGTCGIRLRTATIISVPVLTPFPDVATHVI